MNDDASDLRRYAETRAEDAFGAVVRRNLGLVYRAALRRVGGNVHLAEDVTQLVFTALARNARALVDRPDLAGWLFTTTRFLAAKTLRGEQRRQSREFAAELAPADMSASTEADAVALHAMLDDVVVELRELDRQVLLLRFHRGLRLAEIGAELGATENAVQKRLERALEQLREKLARRGVTSTAAALALAFEQQAAVAVPAGLAAAAVTAGIAGGTGGVLAGATLMTISKVQIGLAAAVAFATSVGLVWEVREGSQLRAAATQSAAATETHLTELRGQLAALTQRASAAETDAAQLEKALQAARAVSQGPMRPLALSDSQEEARTELDRAGRLRAQGRFVEALELYLQLYRRLEGVHGMPDRQMVAHGMQALAKDYPPAKLALRELRDAATQKLHDNPRSRDLVVEITHLNESLDESRASLALYDSLPAGDPGRQAVAIISYKAFIEAQRYADAMVGKSFGAMLNEFDLGMRSAGRSQGQSRTNMDQFLIRGTLDNIEGLAGAGQRGDLRTLVDKLYAYDGSETVRAAVKQRLERAGFQGTP